MVPLLIGILQVIYIDKSGFHVFSLLFSMENKCERCIYLPVINLSVYTKDISIYRCLRS